MPCVSHPDRESVAQCVTCGAEVCAECGHEVGGRYYCPAHAAAAETAAPPPPAPAPSVAPAPAVGTDDPTKENPALAALSYVLPAVLCLPGLIPAIVMLVTDMKKSRYMRFHAMHTIFVTVAYHMLLMAGGVVSRVGRHLPFPGHMLVGLVWLVLPLGWLVLCVILAVKAYNKQELTLPVITQMAHEQADKMRV